MAHDEEVARVLTTEEVRTNLLKHIKRIAHYWANLPNKTPQERCDGTAWNILSALDGIAGGLPGFKIIPRTYDDDMEYNKANGNNWYPPAPSEDTGDVCDVSGYLHSLYYEVDKLIILPGEN